MCFQISLIKDDLTQFILGLLRKSDLVQEGAKMSVSLNLVIYKQENGVLIEEGLKTVRCEEISQSLLEVIANSFPTKETTVYFDRELEESFDIQYFDNSDVASIIKFLHELFHKLLSHENKILNSIDIKVSEQPDDTEELVTCILPNQSEPDPTGRSITRFRILTGIIGVFSDKQNMLADEAGAFIKIG